MSRQYSCGIGKGADLRLEHAALVFERREEYDDSYLLGRRALPKEGLHAPGVEAHVGELYLADISVPPSLGDFQRAELVELGRGRVILRDMAGLQSHLDE